MNNDNYEQNKFNEVFDKVYNSLKYEKKTNTNYTITDLEGYVNCLYINEGNNWEGRSSIADINLNATIAAAEEFLAEWREELKKNNSK